ncbi:uncharacterized protein NEMAJ01_2090 [Nematocida major]|uniref:uncharacterized protein n=1 Tax=Nematocida major TaxID=1912982 RepID=UPI002008AE5B|nr:uncharacterized protein NEMAJ01_2090 [Nematocida major]KAH9387194.1 hypothetical protein NEMAJ01_2090 [Nematocida major]
MDRAYRELLIKIKEGIQDVNALSLDSIRDETVVEGFTELLKNAGVNNVIEYFRKYRRLEDAGTLPVSSLFLKEQFAHISSPVSTKYSRIFKAKGHFSKVLCMMFDRSETFVFTGGEDGLVKIWDVYSGRAVQSLSGHRHPIFDFAVDFSNKYFISCDQSGRIICWDLQTYAQIDTVSIGEQIDYLDVLYNQAEAEPLEQKRAKSPPEAGGVRVQAIVVTNSGRILRVSLAQKITVETVLGEVEEETFNGAVTTKGRKMVIVTGMWPFSILLDANDAENRFYVLDTDDLLSSSVDIAHNSMKFTVSTYSSTLITWEYRINSRPTKSNIQTRKRFKGRDLEGCWTRSTIDLEGMGETIYNTDLIYLIDDVTIVAVDTESNIRIINTESKAVKMVEREYKITGIVPHPTKNIFLTVEVNGVIKVVGSTGEILNKIHTDVSVAGTIVIESTGSFFYIADLDGYVHKYSVIPDEVEVPETEYALQDFQHYCDYNTEQLKILSETQGPVEENTARVYEERIHMLEQAMKVCRNSENFRTFSSSGEGLPPAESTDRIPRYVQGVDKWIRNVEVAGLLQLQSEMITSKVFERDYRKPSQAVIVQESAEEASEENENSSSSSSNWMVEDSDNYAHTDDSAEESLENSEEKDSESGDSESAVEISSGSAEFASESDERRTGRGNTEFEPEQSPQILSKKRGRRQAARKAACLSADLLYNWYMSDKPSPQVLPQVGDRLFLVREGKGLKEKGLEEVLVESVEYGKSSVAVFFAVERTREKKKFVLDAENFSENPFRIQEQVLEFQRKRYRKNDEIYYYADGGLCRGSVVGKSGDVLTLRTGDREVSVNIYDLHFSVTDYSLDLTEYIDALMQYKEEYLVFYRDVPRAEYPDYYELIARPITASRIARRIRNHYYRTKEALLADIQGIFTNCCEYNEEDSAIAVECGEFVQALLGAIGK